MIKYGNNCIGCRDIGLPCMGDACRNQRAKRFYCDKCGDEVKTLYVYNDEHICGDCLLGMFDVAEDVECSD